MKYVCLLCLASIIATPLYSEEETKAKEPRKPTWIERVFGFGDDEPAEEAEVEADSKVAEKEKAKKPKQAKEAEKSAASKFTKEEREVLESWQKSNASWKKSKKPLPPGLQKKVDRGGELPPRWKKKLEVGTVLDPEVDAVAVSLPEEILKRLPETEEGAEIVRVGRQIIKVIEGSREIVDIIDGVTGDSSDKD